MRIPLLILPLLGLFVAMGFARPVAAQGNNPTIADIQSNPNAFLKQVVTLSGAVRAVTDINEFLLDDGTGQIIVDAGPPWYQRISIPAGTPIRVTGEIDWMGPPANRRGIELDACRIETPNQTLNIRDCAFSGPPPWAGGPNRGGRGGRP